MNKSKKKELLKKIHIKLEKELLVFWQLFTQSTAKKKSLAWLHPKKKKKMNIEDEYKKENRR